MMWKLNDDGSAVGVCAGCDRAVAAVGLAPLPDRMVFGRWVAGGWFCEHCKPRVFGRPNGRPPLAERGHADWVPPPPPPARDLRPRLVKQR